MSQLHESTTSLHSDGATSGNSDLDENSMEVPSDLEPDSAEEQKESNYVCLTPNDILREQQEEINKISELFEVPPATARQLLIYMKWDVEKLVERYYDGEKIFKSSGIANPKNSVQNTNKSKKTTDECTICFETYPMKDFTELPCGHSFCNNCWREYLTFKIMDEGKVKVISCPAKGCNMQVDEVTVGKLLTDPKVRDKYVQMIAQAYVEDNPNCRWCPGRGCQNAVRVKLLKEKEVTCTCGTKFCFGCGELPHAPADCKMVKEWKKKLAQEGETAHFLASYTKECPKCNTNIHKEGGCQYMTCAKCGHRFCWICLGAFDHVDHACNKYKEERSVDKNSERAKLNRFMHYLLRFQTHDQSSKLEGRLMDKANQIMNELSEKGVPWIDVQYIKTATLQLMEARNMLKWTYVYGYYLPPHVNRDIFEYLQADLEAGTERLSGLLEAPGEKDRIKIINAAEYVKQRIKNLLEGLAENEITGGSGNKDNKEYKVDSIEKYEGWIYKVGK